MCFCFRHKNPKIPQKMLTNYHPGGNIYRQSMDCKTEYGRVPEWPMGTDCKSAAFSFGGSNPPAPTKRTSVEITLVFCFARHLKSPSRGWIRTASALRIVRRAKKPRRGFFRCAARDIHPRPPKKPQCMKARWGFCFATRLNSSGRWIRTAAALSQKTAQKQPRWTVRFTGAAAIP